MPQEASPLAPPAREGRATAGYLTALLASAAPDVRERLAEIGEFTLGEQNLAQMRSRQLRDPGTPSGGVEHADQLAPGGPGDPDVPVRLHRSGREIRMLIDRADPFYTAQPDLRLIKLLIRAHRFNATLAGSGGTPFAALAKQEGVSPSYFTRLVRLSYLAPDITQAILDGRQPSHLTADKLLAHSRLPLAWQDQRTLLGFA